MPHVCMKINDINLDKLIFTDKNESINILPFETFKEKNTIIYSDTETVFFIPDENY